MVQREIKGLHQTSMAMVWSILPTFWRLRVSLVPVRAMEDMTRNMIANTGLGSGDEVDVRNNPLSATSLNTHIPILQGRGVNVQFGASKPTIEKIEPGSRFKQGIMPR
ncbi:MAG: hypothetical protein OXN20_12955 [Gemmatimonadota bacterium]|nr:hypothetical protein [Gemmatimonadota bacterium]